MAAATARALRPSSLFLPVRNHRQPKQQNSTSGLRKLRGRIAAIRAERSGEGIALTPRQARALAGEWYDWFVARHPTSDLQKWEALRDEVHEAMREAAGEAEWERSEPDDLWREDEDLRRSPSSCSS